MKHSLALKIAAYTLLLLSCNLVFAAALPPGYPPGLYDEANVPGFTLPDPLVMLNGDEVKDINTWKQKRRPEIIKLFETNVYGRTMIGRPDGMTWKVTAENRSDMNGTAITKKVTIYFTGKEDGPKMDVNFILPIAATKKPVPIFLVPGWVRSSQLLLNHGFGIANFNPNQIEPDNKDGYPKSVRKFFAKPDQNTPGPDEWGAIGAWAWAMSRAMDYIVTDKDIDAGKVCIMGVSRYGKVAMWAGAQDERFAIVFSGESGCGGAVIVRRGFGETVKSINGYPRTGFAGISKPITAASTTCLLTGICSLPLWLRVPFISLPPNRTSGATPVVHSFPANTLNRSISYSVKKGWA